jgi:hypothetical protein
VSEYTPFLVIAIFGAALFLGTILWTECLFPENKSPKQEEFAFKKAEPKSEELVSSHR